MDFVIEVLHIELRSLVYNNVKYLVLNECQEYFHTLIVYLFVLFNTSDRENNRYYRRARAENPNFNSTRSKLYEEVRYCP